MFQFVTKPPSAVHEHHKDKINNSNLFYSNALKVHIGRCALCTERQGSYVERQNIMSKRRKKNLWSKCVTFLRTLIRKLTHIIKITHRTELQALFSHISEVVPSKEDHNIFCS
jgi:ribosomal protein S20